MAAEQLGEAEKLPQTKTASEEAQATAEPWGGGGNEAGQQSAHRESGGFQGPHRVSEGTPSLRLPPPGRAEKGEQFNW